MTNPLHELEALGQSVWLDDINREYLHSGLFARLIAEDGLGGATGNPTIFEHAIDSGHAYDEQLRQLLAQDLPAQQIYEQLAISDVQQVADLLHPVCERGACEPGRPRCSEPRLRPDHPAVAGRRGATLRDILPDPVRPH